MIDRNTLFFSDELAMFVFILTFYLDSFGRQKTY